MNKKRIAAGLTALLIVSAPVSDTVAWFVPGAKTVSVSAEETKSEAELMLDDFDSAVSALNGNEQKAIIYGRSKKYNSTAWNTLGGSLTDADRTALSGNVLNNYTLLTVNDQKTDIPHFFAALSVYNQANAGGTLLTNPASAFKSCIDMCGWVGDLAEYAEELKSGETAFPGKKFSAEDFNADFDARFVYDIKNKSGSSVTYSSVMKSYFSDVTAESRCIRTAEYFLQGKKITADELAKAIKEKFTEEFDSYTSIKSMLSMFGMNFDLGINIDPRSDSEFIEKACAGMAEYIVENSGHIHSFTDYAVKPEALEKEASCTENAVYRVTCADCGAPGEETFEAEETVTGHTYVNSTEAENALVSEADCEHNAVYRVTCADCGAPGEETFEAEDTAKGHDFGAGHVCRTCSRPENGVDGFKSANLTLSGKIAVNFKAALSDEAMTDENAYMLFNISDGTSQKIYLKDLAAEDKAGNICTFTCSLFATQMHDTVTAKMVYSKEMSYKAETEPVEFTYSVEEYNRNKQESESSSSELKTMLTDMMNFGEYVHHYNDSSYTADAPELSEVHIGDKFTRVVSEPTVTGIRAKSASLSIGSLLTIAVKYELTEDCDINDYTFTVDGKKYTPVCSENGIYEIRIDGLKPTEYGHMFDIRVSAGDEVQTVSYSAYSYAKSMLENSTKGNDIKNLCRALYYYGESAEAYINKK